VIEADPRLDVCSEQGIDEPIIEIEACFICLAAPKGKHPRPGDREAIRVYAKIAHQRHVFFIAIVVIAGDVARVIVLAASGRGVSIWDTFAAAALFRRAFDLEARRRHTPHEFRWPGANLSLGLHFGRFL